MKKVLLAAAFLVLGFLGYGLALPPANNMTGLLPPVPCPYAAAGYADGCSAGAVVPGLPQNAALLARYGTNRPPWNVAGVDYRVGAPSEGLADPAGSTLPACASYAAGTNNMVTINSAPCTIDHFDFSLHNCVVITISSSITSGVIDITNNNFVAGSGCASVFGGQINNNSTGTIVNVLYNSFDQSYTNLYFADFIGPGSGSTFVVEYNTFTYGIKDGVDPGGNSITTLKYNYLFALGVTSSHSEWFQLAAGTGTTVSLDSEFNTIVQTPVNRFTTGGQAAWCYADTNNGVTATSIKCANETYIIPPAISGGNPSTFNIRIEPGNISFPATITNNYMDASGGFANIETRSTTGTATVTCTGNQDMTTGARITTSNLFVVGTPFMTCN